MNILIISGQEGGKKKIYLKGELLKGGGGGGGGGEKNYCFVNAQALAACLPAKHRLIAMQGIASKNDGVTGTIVEVGSVSVLLRKYSNVSG